ncbi:MAG: hypothetical protein K9N21_10020 [Deltaproteobacteria bacterium]|nr:hypothetical protein [Deltaproteobacteria bacterium]
MTNRINYDAITRRLSWVLAAGFGVEPLARLAVGLNARYAQTLGRTPMPKDIERQAVIEILQDFGFTSSEIPEEPQKGRRADIRATKGNQSFLIEVKTKEDHPEFTAALNRSNYLEIVPYEKQLHRSNTFGKIIREGVSQLEQTPDDAHSFKCIWFRAIESLFSDAFDFMKATLYGTRHLLVCDKSGRFSHANCFYFDHNEFFKYPSLDAVVLDNGRGAELSVNSFSRRLKEFRCSLLYQLFESGQALTDPHKLEQQNDVLVADTDVSRDKEAVVKYIQEKYGIFVNPIKMKSMGGAILYTPK